jgi:hypothetical protein
LLISNEKRLDQLKSSRKTSVNSNIAKESKDQSYLERQIEEIKVLTKQKTTSLKERESVLPNRPEFPTRFCAKPFVHYGNSQKLAAIKK